MARRSREEWLEHARAWKASGLDCGDFAKKAGLSARTLSWWAWKLRSEGEQLERRPRKRRPARSSGAAGPKRKRAERPAMIDMVDLGAVALGGDRVELDVAGVTIRLPDEFTGSTLSKVLEVLEARR